MKLLTFHTEKVLRVGIKTERGILDIAKAASKWEKDFSILQSIEQIVDGGDEVLESLAQLLALAGDAEDDELWLREDSIQLGPCVPHPGKIICVGLNYRKHAEESNLPIPESPVLFGKFGNSIAAHGEQIPLPQGSSQVDYEAELAIVIGKKAKHVPKETALEYVFGYCNANDLSARDLQSRTSQWLLGKSCDGFCPVGPYLVTSDEVESPNHLRIRSIVNGEVRQDSNTGDMIFACDEIVSYISSYMTLMPGDIILTGTPEGVILGHPKQEQIWLQAGDEVTIEIEKLGRLTNRFQNEA
ncbi:fumarylacetoacetate hydrolase family protein [Brevibacillus sp. NRS-1366]|uniref:fumarylacetoacetate hydrolase family protein n=1 Tax=Brevibacillus sp. NRS-1366 TaxID=3233899 RepID=UPI003D1FCA29